MLLVAKTAAYSLISVVIVLFTLVVGAYVRLTHGPVSLEAFREVVENKINQSLPGMAVSIGGLVLEPSDSVGVPHLRLIDLRLEDKKGVYLASAPRASFGIEVQALLGGRIVSDSITLIGPTIHARRGLDGNFALGFDERVAEDVVLTVDAGEGRKSDFEDVSGVSPSSQFNGTGTALINLISGAPQPGSVGINSINVINIEDARITFYDEANDVAWNIRDAELSFIRQSDGFRVEAMAAVLNSGGTPGDWNVGGSATYQRASRSFRISAHVSDLSPANISDQIYALSNLARVHVPLSGRVDIVLSDTGKLNRAVGEFTAAAGVVDLPEYIAGRLNIDKGSLRAEYDPANGSIAITESALLIGSSHAQITGRFSPERNEGGLLTAIHVSLEAHDVSSKAKGSIAGPPTINHILFDGRASLDEARLDIKDLQIISGKASVRLQGAIAAGNKSPAIFMSGRIKHMPAALLKRLWPPTVVEQARAFAVANVEAGIIAEGDFAVQLVADQLAEAMRLGRLPHGSVYMNVKMQGVTISYFKQLPPLVNATGEAHLVDNEFSLKIDGADVMLPSGGRVRLVSGIMVAHDILAVESIAEFDLNIVAKAQQLVEYLDQPDIDLIHQTNLDTSKLEGDVVMKVNLSFPLIKSMLPDHLKVSITAQLSNASLRDALPGIDITDGTIDISMDKGLLVAKGPAKIRGIPSEIYWQRGPAPEFTQSAVIKTRLEGEQLRELGVDLDAFVRGPVAVTATIVNLADLQGRVDVAADLGEVEMRIPQIGWSRPATAKTTAKMTFYGKGGKAPRVENLEVKGQGLSIKGSILLAPRRQGLRVADFTELRLSDEHRFAATVKATDNFMDIQVTGDSFDARPLIRSLFANKNSDEAVQAAEESKANSGSNVRVNLSIGRVHANLGEIITSVRGTLQSRAGRLTAGEISGTFLSGQPIVFRMTPAEGGVEMRINGLDGGAAIRATNLYSKVAGGKIEFYALLKSDGSAVSNGKLVLRDFEVRNEAALAELDAHGKPKHDAPRRDGPRRDALSFKRLSIPFTSDSRFICIGESLVYGAELGASAAGLIRKSDGAIDIVGTITPAYALNAAIGEIPWLGTVMTGGKGQGVISITFAMIGTVDKLHFQINPISAVAPGFLRRFFESGSQCVAMKQVDKTAKSAENESHQ